MANIGLALGGLAEGYQRQQEQQQRQLYQQFLVQQAQQQAARQAQQEQQQQQALGAMWGAAGRLGGAGMGGQPQQPMPQQQPQPLPQVPSATSAMGGGGLPKLQSAILNIESGNRDYPPDSRTGAVGPGQIQPSTAAGYGVGGAALRDPAQNRQLSGRIVGDLYNKYGGNPLETAVGYNAGPGVADKFRAAGDNPSMLPKETQGYLQKLQPLIGEAKQTSQQVTQAVPQQQWGRSSFEDLARAVQQANPDATPQVKMLALMQLQKLMAPSEKMEFQALLQQNRGLIQEEIAKMRSDTQLEVGEMRGRSAAEAEAGRNQRFEKGEAGRNARAQARNDIQTSKAQRQAAGTNPATRRLALQNLLTDIDTKIRSTDDADAKAEYQAERDDIVKEMQGLAGVPKRNPTPRKDVDESGAGAALPPQ